MTMTALDDLCVTPFHEAAGPLRARVLSRLADTEVFVTLLAEPGDDRAELRIVDYDGLRVAIACDTEDRLSSFWEAAVPYAAMPGRVLAGMLAEQGAALLLNPGQRSEMLLDPKSLNWLDEALASAPEGADTTALPQFGAPEPAVVASLLEPLSQRLADMTGLAQSAALVSTQWSDGRQAHMLLIQGAKHTRQPAIAKALSELMAFLPPIEGGVDIAFAPADLPSAALIAALVIEIPQSPASAVSPVHRSPDRDDAPPRLR